MLQLCEILGSSATDVTHRYEIDVTSRTSEQPVDGLKNNRLIFKYPRSYVRSPTIRTHAYT